MRWYTAKTGERRLWYAEDEIESLMEAELGRAGLLPTADAPAVDVERFVERHLGARLDQYADLEPNTLGVTEFFGGEPPRIAINKDLTGSALDDEDPRPGLPGRWRATVAHEAAHVLLHRRLYDLETGTLDLFATVVSEGAACQHRCLKRDLAFSGGSDWREVQANKGMAALLMPRRLFVELARAEIGRVHAREQISDREAISIGAVLATQFAVSRHAAVIRLKTTGFVAIAGQRTI